MARKPKGWKETALSLIWPGLNLVGLVFFSWLNATQFDQTELKMLGEFAVYWKIISEVKERL